ncbi:MAG: HD domain-containing phosphohydrolase, partial [Acetivibrio ethanolgignens]
PEKYHQMINWVREQKDCLFTEECIELWTQSIDYEYLKKCSRENCNKAYSELNSAKEIDAPVSVLRDMAGLFAQITDYKSHFTWRHSIGIAEKAEIMGKYYGLEDATCSCLYIAGALHDIGKLMIPENILEKPGKLTKEEYSEIQNHAVGTYHMLSNIGGLEDITRWAALHHEKLDGSGYPFGLKGNQLGKMERLMACLDIYQALREERPYKKGFSHKVAIDILKEMGANNQLDMEIIKDIDNCMDSNEPINNENSQTYSDDDNTVSFVGGKESWSCPVCGYLYEGTLPEEFICPRCEQPGTVFVRTKR